jgi:DNA end-binding protein Ku
MPKSFAKDQYVRLTPTELDQLQAAESQAMQILEFVPLTAIDPIYFENTFHLGAEKQGEKAYQLLVHAMEDMERVALVKFVWRGKDGLYVVRAVQDRLLLHKMHYQDEIREFEGKLNTNQKPGAAELKLATQLIDSISSPAFEMHDRLSTGAACPPQVTAKRPPTHYGAICQCQ